MRLNNKLSLLEIYQNIFPWKNLNAFTDTIRSSIVYISDDKSLIAVNKPFGVGIYKVQDDNVKKQNQDKILYKLSGSPKYCLNDVMEPFTQEFSSPRPYKILKSVDRYMSGVVLLTNDYRNHRGHLERSLATSKCNNIPPLGFRGITCGYPLINSDRLFEKVGIELVEVDELGDHKEPIIVDKVSRKFLIKPVKDKAKVQVELNVKKINKELAVSLVEMFVSKNIWDFPRCYLSSKTTFVLGDVRFSKRVRRVFDKHIQISVVKSQNFDDTYEPLSKEIMECLKIKHNSQIPLMLDQFALRLLNFHKDRPEGQRDLHVISNQWPLHLRATAEHLGLVEEELNANKSEISCT